MKIKPILFNTEMVRAILEGRKTQTRRIVQQKYGNTHLEMFTNKYGTRLVELQNEEEGVTIIHNPDGSTTHRLLAMIEKESPYRRGEILWVRETCRTETVWQGSYIGYEIAYKAGGKETFAGFPPMLPNEKGIWRPSIHMPKEAARIFLRVTDVRAEHLHAITEDDAMAEGVTPEPPFIANPYIRAFVSVWERTIRPGQEKDFGWAANPWVWVITFERCEKPEGWPDKP